MVERNGGRSQGLARLKSWARRIRADALTLWYAARHPGTPWTAKLLAVLLVAYAFSPIDLIPDFIPIVGLLDDALLLPLGILAVMKLVPPPVAAECRSLAQAHLERGDRQPTSRAGAVAIALLWVLAAVALWAWLR